MNPLLALTSAQWPWVVWTVLGVIGAVGLLAILSPRLFSRLATCGSKWVDTDKLLKKLDRRVDMDRYVLRHCRLFGMLIVAAAVVLAMFVT